MRRTALIVLLLASTVGCNFYIKPKMYVSVSNVSGQTLRNIEVAYPGGSYGMPALGDQQTNRRIVEYEGQCKFTVNMEDTSGKKLGQKQFDVGGKCPEELLIEIKPNFEVESRSLAR